VKLFKPLRILLCFLVISGSAKLVLAVFDDHESVGVEFKQPLFSFTNPSFAGATKPEKKEEAKPIIAPQQCETPEEIFLAIDHERDLLKTQKAALDERKAGVRLAEEKLKQETTRLRALKTDIEGLLMRVEQAKSDDLKRLVLIYSGMKPKEAAGIMNTLDIEVTVMVLGQMKERDAAPIFAKLNTVRSQAVSKIILERSKLPGDQNLNGISIQ